MLGGTNMNVPLYNRDKYYRIMDRTQSNYANQLKRISKDAKRSDFILIYYSMALIVYALSAEFYPGLFDSTWTSYSSIILSTIVLIYSIVNSKAGYPERISKIQTALNEVKRLKREVGSLPNFSHNDTDSTSQVDTIPDEECQNCGNKSCTNRALCCEKLERLKLEYDRLVSNTEVRDDLDFYYTIRHLCKEYDINLYTGKKNAHRFTRKLKNIFSKNETPETVANDKSDEVIIKELNGYISENAPHLQRIHILFLHLCHLLLYVAPIIIFVLGIFFKHTSFEFGGS